MEETTVSVRGVRRSFSIVGLGFSALIVVSVLARIGLAILVEQPGWESLPEQPWWNWICTFAPMYLLAFPACYLVLRRLPAEAPKARSMTIKRFLILLPICFCLMYAGNLLGSFLSSFLSGGEAVNELDRYVTDTHPLKILMMVVLAPVLEELACRKWLVDRTVCYGEKLSVLMSGLVFGLLHGNFFQFFYAFALGSLFAYVYIRTGRVRYPMIFHVIINFCGAVVSPAVMNLMSDATAVLDTEKVTFHEMMNAWLKTMVVGAYGVILLGLAAAGLVLLICYRRKVIWETTSRQVPGRRGLWAALLNVGMILYTVLCFASIALALFNF